MTKELGKRNAAKSRKVCEAMAEAASTSKRVLSERERQILALWPRFEDGELVMAGDVFQDCKGDNRAVCGIEFYPHRFWLVDDGGWHVGFGIGERVKRPAPEVLDADGVEIKVGDTVWHCIGIYDELVVEEIDDESGWVRTRSANGACLSVYNTHLTHTRPDSWELLEEDSNKDYFTYWNCSGILCDACPAVIEGHRPMKRFKCDNCEIAQCIDIVRRAKALAGVEAGR